MLIAKKTQLKIIANFLSQNPQFDDLFYNFYLFFNWNYLKMFKQESCKNIGKVATVVKDISKTTMARTIVNNLVKGS